MALGIFLLLVATLLPMALRYRGHSAVNRAIELAKIVTQRAGEEAKSAGYPLNDSLKQNGLAVACVAASTPGTEVSVRLRKRLRAGGPVQTITERKLSDSGRVTLQLSGLGLLDLEAETDINGVFVEFVQSGPDGAETILATIPADVNGEFVLRGASANGSIVFHNRDYSNTLNITHRGVVTTERR